MNVCLFTCLSLHYRRRKSGVSDVKQKQVREHRNISVSVMTMKSQLCYVVLYKICFINCLDLNPACQRKRNQCVLENELKEHECHAGDFTLILHSSEKVLASFSRCNNLPALTETTVMMVCMLEFHPRDPEQIRLQEKLQR